MNIIDKFNVKTTFLNACVLINRVLHIGTEVVTNYGLRCFQTMFIFCIARLSNLYYCSTFM